MKKVLLFSFFFINLLTINAQTIFGVWKSRNDETHKIDSYIKIYPKNGKAYAKIIKIIDKNRQNAVCNKCEGKNKNKPILGMTILYGLTKKDNEWSNGKILDPRNGKLYNCYIKLEEKNKLKIRGYIGLAFFGRTTYWHRAQ